MRALTLAIIYLFFASLPARAAPAQGAAGTVVVSRLNDRAALLLPRAIKAERSPIKGVWEVYLEDGTSVFTDELATHVIAGSLIALPAHQGDLSEREWERGAYVIIGDRTALRKAAVVLDPEHCSERCRRQVATLFEAKETRIYIVLSSSANGGSSSLACANSHERALRAWAAGENVSGGASRARGCGQSVAVKKMAQRFESSKKPLWINLAGPSAKEPGLDLTPEAQESERKK